MQADGGVFVESPEVDRLEWVTPDQATEMLTHERDQEILERFVRGPKLTGSVLLVRHASAGSSSKWEGDDNLRPLDEKGWDQTQELVRLLSRFKVTDVISADPVRCVQTVRAFADAVGLNVKEENLFSQDGYPGNEEEAVARVGSSGSPTDRSSSAARVKSSPAFWSGWAKKTTSTCRSPTHQRPASMP